MLSLKQVLLLENLMYATPRIGTFPSKDSFEGQTVGEWIHSMDIHSASFKSNDAFMNTREWLQILHAVMKEDAVMRMTILTTHVDNSPGGGEDRALSSSMMKPVRLSSPSRERKVPWSGRITSAAATQRTPHSS